MQATAYGPRYCTYTRIQSEVYAALPFVRLQGLLFLLQKIKVKILKLPAGLCNEMALSLTALSSLGFRLAACLVTQQLWQPIIQAAR